MINKIKELVTIATELGGTAFDVAEDAGLFSAYQFLELHLNANDFNEGILPKSAALVTEAFIHFEDSDELDRVFLYSGAPYGDTQILAEGCITDSKLIIEYSRLKELAAKGYSCIYNRSKDGHNGKAFVRYHNAFGDRRMMVPFEMWSDDHVFTGNGFNQALFVTTKFERVFVMPDIYSVEESIRTIREAALKKEQQNSKRWQARAGRMKEGELALLFDFDEWDFDNECLKLSLIRKNTDNTFTPIGEPATSHPAASLPTDSFTTAPMPGLREIVCNDIKQFLLDWGLREIGINGQKPADQQAFQMLRNSYPQIKRQLTKNNAAKIVFDNGYLRVTEDYPIRRFEKCFERILPVIDRDISRFLGSNGVSPEDISVVLAIGGDSAYPFLIKHLEEFMKKETYYVKQP